MKDLKTLAAELEAARIAYEQAQQQLDAEKLRVLTVSELHQQLSELIELGAGDFTVRFSDSDNYGHAVRGVTLEADTIVLVEER